MQTKNDKLRAENQILRMALQQIADHAEWPYDLVAREALNNTKYEQSDEVPK